MLRLTYPCFSTGLPDNVFDPGERPAKTVQKRVKVGFGEVNVLLHFVLKLERGRDQNQAIPHRIYRISANGWFLRIEYGSRSLMPFTYLVIPF